jgi:ubiquinone/menaquinone biosynthesis C-methylase UbiE
MLVFEEYADEAIAACKLKPNSTVLDVACGPGTLALKLAHHAAQVHGIDFSVAMLAVFRNKIEQAGHRNIALHCGDAQTLPYADNTFDAAFSLFGLMFFPDRQQGFAEIHRTLKPGSSIAVTSWAPVDQSPAMMTMFGALRAIKPELPQPQRSVTTLENPERFKQEMIDAGFRNIEIRKVTRSLPRQVSYPALARGVDGCKAQRAANGHSIGERCNTADAAPRTNPKGHSPAGALRRCGLLVENSYTAQSTPCTASRRRVARGMKPTEAGSWPFPSAPPPNSGKAWSRAARRYR